MIKPILTPKGFEQWLRDAISFIKDVFKDERIEPSGSELRVVSYNTGDPSNVAEAEELLMSTAKKLPPGQLIALLRGRIFMYFVKEGIIVAPVREEVINSFGIYGVTEPFFHEVNHRIVSVNADLFKRLMREVVDEAPEIPIIVRGLSDADRARFATTLNIFIDELYASYVSACYLRYLSREPCVLQGFSKLMLAEGSVMLAYNALCTLVKKMLEEEARALCRNLYPPNLLPLIAVSMHEVFTATIKEFPATVAGKYGGILNGREKYIRMKEDLTGVKYA